MKRTEFAGVFLGLMVKKIETWLPEEATEEVMLDTMLQRISEHRKPIRELLIRRGKE